MVLVVGLEISAMVVAAAVATSGLLQYLWPRGNMGLILKFGLTGGV
jgi:hypothetical protein